MTYIEYAKPLRGVLKPEPLPPDLQAQVDEWTLQFCPRHFDALPEPTEEDREGLDAELDGEIRVGDEVEFLDAKDLPCQNWLNHEIIGKIGRVVLADDTGNGILQTPSVGCKIGTNATGWWPISRVKKIKAKEQE